MSILITAWELVDISWVSGQVSAGKRIEEVGDQDLSGKTGSQSDFHQRSLEHVVQSPYFGNTWNRTMYVHKKADKENTEEMNWLLLIPAVDF